MTDNLPVNLGLLNALKQRNPTLTHNELLELMRSMQDDIGGHLVNGDKLAFLRRDENSKAWDLIVYENKIINKKRGGSK